MSSDSSQTALITGASAGIGQTFAWQLAAKGLHLVLVARRAERLEALAQDIRSQHPNLDILCVAADLSDKAAPAHIYQTVTDANLTISYLVNNAGASGPDLFDDSPWEDQAAYLRLMMSSMTELCYWFGPGMREQRFGRIINVASVAGRVALGGHCHYGPSKAYAIAFSEALSLTVKRDGVHVTALCPGFTHTEFHSSGELKAMKDGSPKFLWYSAEQVVRDGIAAVERGKPVCISGRLYRWFDPLIRSRLVSALIHRFAP